MWKNAKEAILYQEGIRVAYDGEGWHGLQITPFLVVNKPIFEIFFIVA